MQRICEQCGDQFSSSRKEARFCGLSCAGAARRKHFVCTVSGCERGHRAHGLCDLHMGTIRKSRVKQSRDCEMCGAEYGPTYAAQRTCGRECGLALKRANGTVRPKASVVRWRLCVSSEHWYTAQGKRRCACHLAFKAAISTPSVYLFRYADCAQATQKVILGGRSGRRPSRCDDCAVERKRAERRRRTAIFGRSFRSRARAYGVEYEPVNRTKVFERDRWVCGLCSKKVKRAAAVPDPLAPTLDHVLPMSVGGPHTYANVQCAHFICNSTKGAGGSQQLALVG